MIVEIVYFYWMEVHVSSKDHGAICLSKYEEEPEQNVSSSYAKYTLPAQTNKPLEEKKPLKLP